jgi:trigger factor
VERPAGDGDFVSVDIEATVDGEEVPEAAATELLYRVGSGGLVEGVDEALVGGSAGDVIDLDAPLPEGFDRGGHEARFKLTVNEVKELILPDLDDDWVDENTEFETVTELRSQLRRRLEDMKTSQVARAFRDRALETLLDQVEVELPQALVRAERDELLHSFLHRLEDRDVSVDDYFEATGISQEQFLADLSAQAERSLRTRILLEAVTEDARLELEEDEVEAMLGDIARRTESPDAFLKAVRGTPQELSLRDDMLRDKALEVILDHATAVDPEGNEIDLDSVLAESEVGEVVEGEVVEGEVVEGEIVEAEPVEGEVAGVEPEGARPVATDDQDDQESL